MNNKIHWNVSKARILGMDGLRVVAVMLMMLYHFGLPYAPGGFGAMIFLVLSGFLITWLMLKEREKTGTISLSKFYRRRALRILPAFYVYSIVTLLILILRNKEVLWTQVLSATVFLSNYYNALNGDPNNGFSHTWSVSLQEQFYLLWPLVFLLFKSNLRRMMYVQTGIIISVWIYRLILYFAFQVDQGYFYAAFDTRIDGIMVGCLLAVLLKRYFDSMFWALLVERRWYPLIPFVLLLISEYAGDYSYTYRDLIGLVLNPILIAILLAQTIGFIDEFPFKWLESSIMKFLGTISYSLYLYQQLTISFVQNRFSGFHTIVQLTIILLVTIAIATISYYLIEKPFLSLKSGAGRFKLSGSSPVRVDTGSLKL